MTRSPQELRELARAATEASDSQLMKLVCTLDAMPRRGNADTLLDPVRTRLRRLQPPRPVNLPRLLFLPLDALVVPSRDWRPDRGQVPRTAIRPLAAAVAAANPGLADEVRLAGHTLERLERVGPLGDRLWLAAAALPSVIPADAAATGLPAAAWKEIMATCRLAWRHGPALWRLRLAGLQGPPEALARPLLLSVAADGHAALSQALVMSLPFAAQPSLLAATAASLGHQVSPIGEQALERFIAQVKVELELDSAIKNVHKCDHGCRNAHFVRGRSLCGHAPEASSAPRP